MKPKRRGAPQIPEPKPSVTAARKQKPMTNSSPNPLGDQLDREFAPAWRPEPGDKLVGVVTELSSRDGNYGPYSIITVRDDDGNEWAVHAFHEVLANELARIAPKVGDRVGFKYAGKHPERGYHRYRVQRDGDTAFDWTKFAGDDVPATDVPVDMPETDAIGDDIPF